MSRAALATAAAVATGVQVGAAMVASRAVVDLVGPGSLAFLRYAIAVLCLLPFVLHRPWRAVAPRDYLPIAVIGIGQFGVLIALLNAALLYIPAARASVIFAVFPLLTMVIAVAIGRERLTRGRALGVGLSIVGVALTVGLDRAAAGGADRAWLGDLLAFSAALTGAVCSLAYRPYLVRYSSLQVSLMAMLASVAVLAVAAVLEDLPQAYLGIGAAGWAAILFVGLSSGIGFFLWLYALANAEASHVTAFLALSPLTAAAFGLLFLGEQMSAAGMAGVALVVLGLWSCFRASGGRAASPSA